MSLAIIAGYAKSADQFFVFPCSRTVGSPAIRIAGEPTVREQGKTKNWSADFAYPAMIANDIQYRNFNRLYYVLPINTVVVCCQLRSGFFVSLYASPSY